MKIRSSVSGSGRRLTSATCPTGSYPSSSATHASPRPPRRGALLAVLSRRGALLRVPRALSSCALTGLSRIDDGVEETSDETSEGGSEWGSSGKTSSSAVRDRWLLKLGAVEYRRLGSLLVVIFELPASLYRLLAPVLHTRGFVVCGLSSLADFSRLSPLV